MKETQEGAFEINSIFYGRAESSFLLLLIREK
jgi:hypothetical protein